MKRIQERYILKVVKIMLLEIVRYGARSRSNALTQGLVLTKKLEKRRKEMV